MTRRDASRRLALLLAVLAMVVIAGCGGGGGEGGRGVGSLAQGRWGHTATLLDDGRILVVGGQESITVDLSTAEIYDTSTKTWASAGAMDVSRGEGHTATLLKDGRILVVGGVSGGSSTSIYDPATGIWSSGGSMSGDRTWHTATLLNDGRVLVAGGLVGRLTLDTAEIYDPSTNQWSPTGSMSNIYTAHSAALLADGRVLLVGKLAMDIFDPATGTWSPAQKPSTRERWKGFIALVLEDSRILVPGGTWTKSSYGATWVAMPEVDIYDPATGTWSSAAQLKKGRRSYAATLLADGKVLVIGEQSAEVYDPAADTWTSAGKMKVQRIEGHTATLLKDGTVLVVGGRKDATRNMEAVWLGGTGRTEVEIYDPAKGW